MAGFFKTQTAENKHKVTGFLDHRQNSIKSIYGICNLQCQESVHDMLIENRRKGIKKVKVIFIEDVSGQAEKGWH